MHLPESPMVFFFNIETDGISKQTWTIDKRWLTHVFSFGGKNAAKPCLTSEIVMREPPKNQKKQANKWTLFKDSSIQKHPKHEASLLTKPAVKSHLTCPDFYTTKPASILGARDQAVFTCYLGTVGTSSRDTVDGKNPASTSWGW